MFIGLSNKSDIRKSSLGVIGYMVPIFVQGAECIDFRRMMPSAILKIVIRHVRSCNCGVECVPYRVWIRLEIFPVTHNETDKEIIWSHSHAH
jgi:hypothetical protein